jgi:hypothetical protein
MRDSELDRPLAAGAFRQPGPGQHGSAVDLLALCRQAAALQVGGKLQGAVDLEHHFGVRIGPAHGL